METPLELPDYFSLYSQEIQNTINDYLQQLTPIERRAYVIAKHHLGTSFNIVKSNGFIEFKSKRNASTA